MKLKKALAVLLATAMTLGMSMTTFAATPNEGDTAVVTVQNVEAGATMTAYQIIDAAYDNNGFIGYVWAPGMVNEGEKVENPNEEITDTMITTLAKNPEGLTTVNNFKSGDKLPVGTWMIIVTPPAEDAAKVYNPMIVSVAYSVNGTGDNNTAQDGSVNANDRWSLNNVTSYAKSTTIDITKTVDEEDKNAAVGDTVNFTITGEIPSYSSQYTSATYTITDEIVKGLKYPENFTPVVKVGGTELINGQPEDDDHYYTFTNNGNSFVIAFDSDYILSLASSSDRSVEITYDAEVTEEAVTEVGQNKVTLDYSNKPGGSTDGIIDTEYVFTFSLDGLLKKVGEDGAENGLAGAEFTLYKTYTDGKLSNPVKTCTTSEEKGFDIEFTGLDGDITYYLKETKAPGGYSINESVYKIEFTNFQYNGDVLTGYDVVITNLTDPDADPVEGTISYGKPASAVAVQVENTKLSSLPSTGGIGTTIFTIGGCTIMIAAAGLYFASRRKQENK